MVAVLMAARPARQATIMHLQALDNALAASALAGPVPPRTCAKMTAAQGVGGGSPRRASAHSPIARSVARASPRR
jgi:hypothetical protein